MSKVDSVILRALMTIVVGEYAHPSFGLISVNRVHTSRDLHNCTVYVSSTESKDELTKYLNRKAGMIQHELGEAVLLRHIPKLYFKFDDTGEYLTRLNTLIETVDPEKEDQK